MCCVWFAKQQSENFLRLRNDHQSCWTSESWQRSDPTWVFLVQSCSKFLSSKLPLSNTLNVGIM